MRAVITWRMFLSANRYPLRRNMRYHNTSRGVTSGPPRSDLLETVTDAVQRLDHVEGVVDGLELLAQALDVAVDGPVVDVDLVVVGRIHQGVAAFDHAGAARQRLQDE